MKQCIKFLKEPLTDIHNTSLESGIFPDKLKIAKVIPLHKNGDTGYSELQTNCIVCFFQIAREIGVQQTNGIH